MRLAGQRVAWCCCQNPSRDGAVVAQNVRMTALFVAVAGAVGVLARYGLSVAVQSVWTTVAINIVGSFLLGLLVTLGDGLSSDARLVLGVGFLGGFTTFSTFTCLLYTSPSPRDS